MRTLCSRRPERAIGIGRKRNAGSAGQYLTIRDSLRAGDIAVAVASARSARACSMSVDHRIIDCSATCWISA